MTDTLTLQERIAYAPDGLHSVTGGWLYPATRLTLSELLPRTWAISLIRDGRRITKWKRAWLPVSWEPEEIRGALGGTVRIDGCAMLGPFGLKKVRLPGGSVNVCYGSLKLVAGD